MNARNSCKLPSTFRRWKLRIIDSQRRQFQLSTYQQLNFSWWRKILRCIKFVKKIFDVDGKFQQWNFEIHVDFHQHSDNDTWKPSTVGNDKTNFTQTAIQTSVVDDKTCNQHLRIMNCERRLKLKWMMDDKISTMISTTVDELPTSNIENRRQLTNQQQLNRQPTTFHWWFIDNLKN